METEALCNLWLHKAGCTPTQSAALLAKMSVIDQQELAMLYTRKSFTVTKKSLIEDVILTLVEFFKIPETVTPMKVHEYLYQKMQVEGAKKWPALTALAINGRGTSILQIMYADPTTRECARDILRLILYYISIDSPAFAERSCSYINVNVIVTMPPLLRQLQRSISISNEKTLFATAVELNQLEDLELILRCQGFGAAIY